MRRTVTAAVILIALCLTAMPFAAAGESSKKSGVTIDELVRELEGLREDIDRVLERVRRMRSGESEPPAGETQPRPVPLTREKLMELMALQAEAMELLRDRKLEEAIEVYLELIGGAEKAGMTGPWVAVHYYNLACAYSLNEDIDEAFDALMKALGNGYVEFDHITQDTDLENLHDDKRWEEMLSRKDEYIEKARRAPSGRPGSGRGTPGSGRGTSGRIRNERLQELQAMARAAMELLQDRKLEEAIKAYLELVSESEEAGVTDTGLAVHYYNLACAYSLNKDIDKAFETLIKSVEGGYADFVHMEQDSDLDNLHEDGRWKELFEKKDEYIEKARDKILESFTRRFDAEDYLKELDKEHNIFYMTNLGKGTLEAMKSQLNDYADLQWKNLFTYKFRRPLAILCLDGEDFRKVVPNRSVGGFYNPTNHVLVVPELSFTLVHEFTHALHNADMQARRQSHPIWIVEGLGTLFETSVLEGDKIKCLLNPRLEILRRAMRYGNVPSWKEFMSGDDRQFSRNASLNYAYTRYVFYWLWEQGLLRDWYEAYTAGYRHDKTGARAFEYVLNMKLEEAEKKWKEWVLAKPTAPMDMSVGRAFFGVGTEETEEGLKVVRVLEGTGAEKAGLKVGDIILEFEGEKIEDRETFLKSIQARRVGDKIKVKVRRADEMLSLEIELTGRPGDLVRRGAPGQDDGTSRRRPSGRGGAGRMAPTIGARTYDTEVGVVVRSIYGNSTAGQAGMKVGDVIVEFEGEEITDRRQLSGLIRACEPGQKVIVTVERGGEAIEMEVTIGQRSFRRGRGRRSSAPRQEPEEPAVRRGARKK